MTARAPIHRSCPPIAPRHQVEIRPTAAKRGYGSRWQKARSTFLGKHPLCVLCGGEGRTTAATVVDHRIPHKGDQRLFWDTSNWQSLCKPHHDSKTAREDGGFGDRHGKSA